MATETPRPTVRYEVADRVATVTLDRPHRLNAWTGRMHTEYRRRIAEAEADPGVRAIVVTGEGRGFCAGADTGALEQHAEAGRYDDGVREPLAEPGYGVRAEFDHAFAFHYGLTKPVIAAVNGPAAGVGLVLACYCDLRFAAAGAKLTTSAPRLGLPAEFGLSWVLPRLVGLGHAADLLLSSRVVLAEEAATMGLINRVLPADELLSHAHEYARVLATEVSPAAVRAAKHQLYADQHDDLGTSIERAEALLDEMMGAPDYAEGVRAWVDKRPPEFPDPPDARPT
ncbi:enoyl-CoA hydratase-related protein [Dermatobacter hominis]|uniref:enoyl-CoA hydratase-related protein n=1 Tax=Dermatobacter hominis TaxID=2884263 RepID=UPI001D11597D|nr:enoyl-CoA hydratase-related protein [Dermatobacter hominis]UDY34253.1 enoyl-CoA hydratase/isomerase family protein [Dermatobacter hominis]